MAHFCPGQSRSIISATCFVPCVAMVASGGCISNYCEEPEPLGTRCAGAHSEGSGQAVSLLLLPLGGFGLVVLLAAPRLWSRLKWEREHWPTHKAQHQARLLIHVAGKRGWALMSWVLYGTSDLKFVGVLDDDSALSGKHVFGYPIYGREGEIPTIVKVHEVSEIWCTFIPDSITRARLEMACGELGINLAFVPEIKPFARFALSTPL